MEEKKFRDLLVNKIDEALVVLTGLPYDLGCSCGGGASEFPKIARELSSFLPPLTKKGEEIKPLIYDNGDIETCDDYYCFVYKKTRKLFKLKKFNLFLGGDHSVSIPLLRAFYDEKKKENLEPVLIHIDAHPDICDYYNGSKYSHACPVRRAIDYGYKHENIFLVGIRGFEEQEVEYFGLHKEINLFTADDVNEQGIKCIIKSIMDKVTKDTPIYISYDIDANDPAYAPGTGTPEAFGLVPSQILDLISTFIKEYNVQAMDIVEVSPKLDVNNITSWLALKTMYEILYLINRRER